MPNAKIIFLLMVMFASALCSTRDYVIMLKSAHNKALHITAGGKVSAADISKAQNITIGSTGDFLTTNIFKITLFSKEVGRYLCFNKHWKLVGMKNVKESCHFIESLDRGYFEFRSAVNRSRRVGFTRRFRPVGTQRKQDLADACYHFMKIEAENFDQNAIPATGRKSAAVTVTTATTTTKLPHHRRNHQRINKTNNIGHNSNLSNESTSINNNSNLSQTTTNNSNALQPKILVRHNHDNSSLVARRRQHQREQKIRKRRKYIQNQGTSSSSTNLSAKSSSTMLTPSVLNIVATLAASRRTRGRRKNEELRDEDEEDEHDVDAEKQKKVSHLSSTEQPPQIYLSPKKSEHRHRHHNHLHNRNHQIAADYPHHHEDGDESKSTATSGFIQFPNEYSNKNSNTNININNNNIAIPALPKNLYNNNRMTEYVYSGSTYVNNNFNDNINDNDSSSSNSFSDSHRKEMKINNNYNIDNNFKDYLIATKDKDNAYRKNLFEAIKNNKKNKLKNIVQYRYAVSFILAERVLSALIDSFSGLTKVEWMGGEEM